MPNNGRRGKLLPGDTVEAVDSHPDVAEEDIAAEAVRGAGTVGAVGHRAASRQTVARSATELRATHARLSVGSSSRKDQNCNCTKNSFHARSIGPAGLKFTLPEFFVRKCGQRYASVRITGLSCAQTREREHQVEARSKRLLVLRLCRAAVIGVDVSR